MMAWWPELKQTKGGQDGVQTWNELLSAVLPLEKLTPSIDYSCKLVYMNWWTQQKLWGRLL